MASEKEPGARARASRRNGARSRGPKSAAGRAHSARNALRHGLRARQVVLLADEDVAAFQAFEAALHAELAPQGMLQADLVGHIAVAAWRARRADRMEAALFGRYADLQTAAQGADLGAALVRDGFGPRALVTLLRYRGSVQAELFRALSALGKLQAARPAVPAREAGRASPVPAQDTERTREPSLEQGLEPRRAKHQTVSQAGPTTCRPGKPPAS